MPKPEINDGQAFFLKISAFFLVIIVVNVAFVTLALRSNSGLVTDRAYEKGLAYNDILAQARTQEALGWLVAVAVESRTLHLTLRDKDGHPIDGATIDITLTRAVHDREDTTRRAVTAGHGVYTLPLAGAGGYWKLRADIAAQGATYQFHRDIVVK